MRRYVQTPDRIILIYTRGVHGLADWTQQQIVNLSSRYISKIQSSPNPAPNKYFIRYLISVSPAVEWDDLLLADAGLAHGADLAVGPRLKPLQGGNSI